jgi:hypothetical protein
MSFHPCFSMFRRKSGKTIFLMMAFVLTLAVPLSVAATRIWISEHAHFSGTESDKQSQLRPRRPVQYSSVEKMELQAIASVDSDGRVHDTGNSLTERQRQEDEEVLSAVFVGQIFAPAVVALAQRHMIDGPVNRHSDSLLHIACQSGNQLAVWLLLEAGASTSVQNRFEETPLDVAVRTDARSETNITTIMRQRRVPTPLLADPAARQG